MYYHLVLYQHLSRSKNHYITKDSQKEFISLSKHIFLSKYFQVTNFENSPNFSDYTRHPCTSSIVCQTSCMSSILTGLSDLSRSLSNTKQSYFYHQVFQKLLICENKAYLITWKLEVKDNNLYLQMYTLCKNMNLSSPEKRGIPKTYIYPSASFPNTKETTAFLQRMLS